MSCQRFWSPVKALCFSSLFSLFLAAPRHPVYARSCQYSEADETEASSSGSPQKSWIVEHSVHPFPSPKRSWDLRRVACLLGSGLAGAAVVTRCALDQITVFALWSPQGASVCWAHRCSETGEMEASSSGSTRRSWDRRCAMGLSPSSEQPGLLACSLCAEPEGKAVVSARPPGQATTLFSVTPGG